MARPKTSDLHAVRQRLKATLPKRIANTVKRYDQFDLAPPPEDAKGFAAHQAACKAALGHVEALAKLARWADDEAPSTQHATQDDDGLDSLLLQAREAISAFGEDDLDED